MRKHIWIALSAVIIVLIVLGLSNSLRHSAEYTRERLLKQTPIGTSVEDVIKINKKRIWRTIDWISYEHGYGIDKWNTPSESGKTTIGVKSIRVHLGTYWVLFRTDVIVFYGFDEYSKLVDLHVRKDTDSF